MVFEAENVSTVIDTLSQQSENFLVILAVTVTCAHAQGSSYDPNFNTGFNFEVMGESLPEPAVQVGSLQDPYVFGGNGYQQQGVPNPAPGPEIIPEFVKPLEWVQPAPETSN